MEPFFKITLTLALTANSSTALASPVLWQDIEAAMPASRLMQLYPERKAKPKVKWRKRAVFIEQVPVVNCFADVEIVTDKPMLAPNAAVKSVNMEGYGCAGATFRALLAKYGSPADVRNDNEDDLWALNDKVRDATWTDNDKVIHFKSESGGIISNWTVTYTPVSISSGL